MSDLHAGWMEWVATQDGKGRPKVRRLRLVHRRIASLRGRKHHGRQYNSREEFKKNRGIVEGLPLDRFTGPDGLMLLLSMIAEPEIPVKQPIELTKRVQIPGYEAVCELVHDAVSVGVVSPVLGLGFYLQSRSGMCCTGRNAKLHRRVRSIRISASFLSRLFGNASSRQFPVWKPMCGTQVWLFDLGFVIDHLHTAEGGRL